MALQEFVSHAWLLKGISGSVPGCLELQQDHLRFVTPDEVVFDAPRSDVTSIRFPWYYFGGGMKLSVSGQPYRVSFVKPNGAEYALGRASASRGDPRATFLLVASKVSDIGSGRDAGRQWRRLLGAEPESS